MAICVLGTVLALAGHFPHRPRLWVPHLVGLVAMVAVALGRGGDLTRWGGAALLALLAIIAAVTHPAPRVRAEAALDAAAMAAFLLLMPRMDATAGHHHGPATGPILITAILLLTAWTGARVWAARTHPGNSPTLHRINTAGSATMFAGMTLMLA